MDSRPHFRALDARALILAASTFAACTGNESAAAGDGPFAREAARVIPKLEAGVGLKFKTAPKIEMRTRDEVRQFLEQKLATDLPAEELIGQERAYKRFGLLPDTLDLRSFMVALLTEQIAGYYDPSAKVLYVVEGADPALTEMTLSHELVHSLQDQYFNLDSIQKLKGKNDRQVAAQALFEGQAIFEQMSAAIGERALTTALPGTWDRVRELIRQNNEAMPLFSRAPFVIQETLLFPYLSGAEFIRRVKEKMPNGNLFDRVPESTEQILHPERYFDKRDDPTDVTLPPPRTGKLVYENNLGEFETRLLLFQQIGDQASAFRGAAGWDGDRFQLIELGNGEALAWLTVWDSAVEAAEFRDQLDSGLLRRFKNLPPAGGDDMTRTYNVGERVFALIAVEVSGRPAVIYVDAPRGSPVNLIDVSRVRLDE
ncbi:MAG TPA: hypothetical protein VJ717_10625 [Gemmatimonadaceae bacterium]|nr:hypothetical protein [Gemmatimonadaceae bacterium]